MITDHDSGLPRRARENYENLSPLKVLNSHSFSLQVPTSSVSLEMRLTQYSIHVRVLVLFPPPQVLSQDDQERQGENSGGPENKSFRNWLTDNTSWIFHNVFRLYLSMKRYKIKFVTHRLPHCRLLSPRCSLEGDLCSRKCMIVFLTYFHLHMTHCKMTIESMLKALKIQFLWGWRKGQKWVRSPLRAVKHLSKLDIMCHPYITH